MSKAQALLESGDVSAINRDDEVLKASQTNATTGLTEGEARARLEEYGFNLLCDKKENEWKKFLLKFWGPMPIMIWIAIIVEAAQQSWIDFSVLVFLQLLNGCVSYFEEKNAGDAIAALKEGMAAKCNVKRDGVFKITEAKYLVPGDIVNVKLGDVVPADCKLLGDRGELEVDQAALTGESLPVTIYVGEQIKMGSTIKRGELEAVVCFTGSNTFFGKAAALVASVEQQGRFQKVLFRITMVLLGVALFATSVILITLLLNHVDVLKAVGICVVLLVASIPIAMQVVSTSTMAVGARRLAQKKVIVAKLSAIEELAGMDMLCSDKTGTLTQNKLRLFDPILTHCDGGAKSTDEINFYGALAAKRIAEGQDAIDYCITQSIADQSRFAAWGEVDYIPFDPVIKRTEATVRELATGKVIKVTKGAPQIILAMAHNHADIEAEVLDAVQALADRGYRSLGVAHAVVSDGDGDDEPQWVFDGVLSLFDPPREDTAATIRTALEMGIKVKMITGDQTAIAKETARALGMGTNIFDMHTLNALTGAKREECIRDADGFAEVFPEHKFEIVEALQKQGFVVGMTGDGVNDAPALKRAQIGIAVEGSTDAARAAADIVLTEPGLGVIIDAILRARKIFQRVRNYGIYRVACTIQLVCFFFFAVTTIKPGNYFCGTITDTPSFSAPDTSLYGFGTNDLSTFGVSGDSRTMCTNIFGAVVDENKIKDFGFGAVCYKDFEGTYKNHDGFSANKCLETFDSYEEYTRKDQGFGEPLNKADCQHTDANTEKSHFKAVRYMADHTAQCPMLYPAAALPFTIPVLAIVIITILNDVSIITIAHDKVIPSRQPQGWKLTRMTVAATVCGMVPCLSSLLLLVAGLMSADGSDSWYAHMLGEPTGMGGYYLPYSKLIMLLYLKISISDFLTVFSARTEGPFWERRPGYALLTAAIFATTVSSLVAGFAHIKDDSFNMEPLSPNVVAMVWVYNIVWFFVQDAMKVLTYWIFDKLGGDIDKHGAGGTEEEQNAHRIKQTLSNALANEQRQVRTSSAFNSASSVTLTGSHNSLSCRTDRSVLPSKHGHEEMVRNYGARIEKLEGEMQKRVLPACNEIDGIKAEMRKHALHLS
jgi:H+-transporting ATPase